MRHQISNVECPKCGHIFDYDSGWHEFIPYPNKSDAELEVKESRVKYPDTEWSVVPYSNGWIICGRSKEVE